MSFLYPSFLWALFAVAVPVIIHIFDFRTNKTVYFSNVDFLENIEQEAKSRNKIKNLLILLFRILAIVSLVIAFANPVKYTTEHSGIDCNKTAIIYLDNSFSMDLPSGKASCLDHAKSKALQIIDALPADTKYFILTNKLSYQEQHLCVKDIAEKNISNLYSDENVRKTSMIFDKIEDILQNEHIKCVPHIFIISDFQKNTFDVRNINADTNLKVSLLPVIPDKTDNLYIDSIWFASPYRVQYASDSLLVKLINNSANSFTNRPIRLYFNDSLRTISSFSIKAHSDTIIKLFFTNDDVGFISGKTEIDDYPVTYDNTMFFSYYIAPKINLLLIEDKQNKYLHNFYTDTLFNLNITSSTNIPYGNFNKFQAIIISAIDNYPEGLSEELKNYVSNGGIVVFIPPMKSDIGKINAFLTQFNLPVFKSLVSQKLLINTINVKDKIYKNAFESIKPNSAFPQAQQHYALSRNIFDINTVLSFEDNEPFLLYKNIGKGSFYLFSAELDDKTTDFMLSPVMVPTFYNIPIFRANFSRIYYTIGKDKTIKLQIPAAEDLKLKGINSNFEFYPQILATLSDFIKINIEQNNPPADVYKIVNGNKQTGVLSLNYSREESILNFYTQKQLDSLLKKYNLKNFLINSDNNIKLQNDIRTNINGHRYWKIFVIFALIFLLAEIITIRLTDN